MNNIRPLRSMLPSAHQDRFSEFATDLQKAVRQSVPTDFGRYQRASILAFDWSNDTMEVKRLREDLLRLLRRVYGFNTEAYVLNANDPPQAIFKDFRDHLIEFTRRNEPKNGDSTHLLMYYYSGHSDSGPQGNQLRLGGRVNQSGDFLLSHLDWYQLSQFALSVPWCETLLILDSCNSAMAMTGIRPDGEILTAAGWESGTSTNSFTHTLIDEIKSQNGRPFTACDLHVNLITNALKNNMGVIPIHKASVNHPSVLFHRIGSREARELVRAPQTSTARVLITVSVTASILPNVNEWNKWLSSNTPSSNMPSGIRDVEIVANWSSSSRTTLVCVPVQIWDYLRDDPSYNFVSFVLGDVSIGPSPPPEPAS